MRITAFSFVLLIAVLSAALFWHHETRRLKISSMHFWRLLPLLLLSGYLGARVYYVCFAWEQFDHNPSSIFAVNHGGFALFGAFIACLLALFLYGRFQRGLSMGKLMNSLACPMLLLIALGRWGDFFMQSSFGPMLPEDFPPIPFVKLFIDSLQEWHLGLFLFESIACLLILLLLRIRRGKGHAPGDAFLWAIALFGAIHVPLESMRQDSLYLGFVRVGQVCAALLTLSVVGIVLTRIFKANKGFSPSDCSLILAILLSFALVFYMEFNMGKGRELLFRLGLLLGMLFICFFLALLYRKTPYKTKEALAKKT